MLNRIDKLDEIKSLLV